jgi:hypothetical protein
MLEGAKVGGRGNQKPCANLSQGLPTRARERVALYTGMSHASLKKAEEIATAAEKEPGKHADPVQDMDGQRRSLNGVHNIVKARQKADGHQAQTFASPPIMSVLAAPGGTIG